MTDLLSGAVRLGRAALFLSSHTDDSSKLPPSPKKKAPNNAALRTLSRAFYGASNLALSLWDGLTLEERERKRVVEERKTMLIYHMKNVSAGAGPTRARRISRVSYPTSVSLLSDAHLNSPALAECPASLSVAPALPCPSATAPSHPTPCAPSPIHTLAA